MNRLVLIAFAAIAGPLAHAGEDPGKQLVQQGNAQGALACATCHGVDGAGNAAAGFPRLAGLDAGYIARQLQDFHVGTRVQPVMAPIAKALNPDEIQAVAAYYAAQPLAPAPALDRSSPLPQDPGAQLALRGDWSKGVPGCTRCHGAGGAGVGSQFPRLAGQHASYIATQLKSWRDGSRHNDPGKLMETVAKNLDDAQIDAVSHYFAGLGPP